MRYKTKKKNHNLKRQSRKRIHSGGAASVQQIQNPYSTLQNQIQPVTINPQSTSTIDNLTNGIGTGIQLANNGIATGIQYIKQKGAEQLGINPNASTEEEMQKTFNTISKMSVALNSPQGQKALLNLGSVIGNVSEKVIAPGVEEMVDSVIDHSGPILNKGIRAGMDALSITPFGPLIEIPRFLGDIGGIVEDSTSMAADVLNIGKETIDQVKEGKQTITNAVSDVSSLVDKVNNPLTNLSNISRNAIPNVGNYGKIISENNTSFPSKIVPNNLKQIVQAAGGLKKIHNEKYQVSGRINQSINEFINPIHFSILKKGGNNFNKTKKNIFKRKEKPKRVRFYL